MIVANGLRKVQLFTHNVCPCVAIRLRNDNLEDCCFFCLGSEVLGVTLVYNSREDELLTEPDLFECFTDGCRNRIAI
jgi:hypothetical protein